MNETGTQRDKLIEELKRTDALLEYAVQHGEDEEAERLRKKMRELADRLQNKKGRRAEALRPD